MNRVSFLRNLINQQRTIGQFPVELHMNSLTVEDFGREVREQTPDNRSLFDRLRHPHQEPKRLEAFEGLKIVINDALEGSAIVVRPLQLMGDPQWLDHVHMNRQLPMRPDSAREALQQRREESEPADLQKQDDVLSQLTQNAGINPSTVLMKAMEDLDNVQNVIVLRFYKNRAIDLCSTFDRYGVIGALQDSLGYVARGGE